MDKDTKMAWHGIVGRLGSNEEGTRSKALHLRLPPKNFLFTHLVFVFSDLPPCSQSTLKRVWVKHGNKKTLAPQDDMDLSILCFVGFVSDPSR